MNSDERRKIVQAGISKLKYTQKPKLDEYGLLMEKAMTLTNKVRESVLPVLKAGGYFKDKAALTDLISRLYLEGMTKFSKDELENLCTMLHTQLLIETIGQSPFGGSQADAISPT